MAKHSQSQNFGSELMPNKRELQFTIEFKRNVRQLAKKYPRIKSNLQPLIGQLEAGETPGDRVPGVRYLVYKARVPNFDSNKGKRSGYRLLYYCKIDNVTVLLTIYAKNEQEDISPEKVRQIIVEFDEKRGN